MKLWFMPDAVHLVLQGVCGVKLGVHRATRLTQFNWIRIICTRIVWICMPQMQGILWSGLFKQKGCLWEGLSNTCILPSKRKFGSRSVRHPERLLERGDPCWLLLLRWMGTQRVHMKRVLPWLVHWACHACTRDFCSALAGQVSPVQKCVSLPYKISIPHCK